MTHERRSEANNLVIFGIKDRDFLGLTNTFLSECSISFGEIDQSNKMEQKHLNLSRSATAGGHQPSLYLILELRIIFAIFFHHTLDSDSIRVLELRQDDKQAKDFIKKIKKILS